MSDLTIKARYLYLADGSFDTATHIVINEGIVFDSLLQAWETLADIMPDLYRRIEDQLERQARIAWDLETENRREHKEWDARR